jgi:diguanylate cyclase (GGDEF)-like protein
MADVRAVTKHEIDWSGWLRAIAHATTFFGLGMIALIWGAVEFDLRHEREQSMRAAVQTTGNLARAFEDQIIRTVKANDRILRLLQLSSVNGTLAEDFTRWVNEIDVSDDFTAQLTLIDAKGQLVATNLGPVNKVTDLSDREYFTVHRDSAEAGLFVGKPLMGRVSGQSMLPLSRALRGPHGDFAGVIVASISPTKLSRFYQSVDLGADGAINLVGLDGIIRASAGMKVDVVGRSMVGSELMRRVQTAEEGAYISDGIIDGIRRLTSFRIVEGFPLVLWVARSEADVLQSYWRNGYSYRVAAAGLSLFVLSVMIVSVRHRKRFAQAREELRVSEALARETSQELQLTLDHMSQGIMMIDKDATVALMNRRAVQLLGLPEDFVAARPKFDDLVAHQWQSGEFGPDGNGVDPKVRDYIKAGLTVPILENYERARPDGTVLEVRSVLLPEGGFVRTFTDISERKRTEEKIAHMAHHDPLTGLANRVLLRREIDTAMRGARRHGDAFALLLIDLDRFKAVNDTLGHVAGDALLKEVTQRLRGCVRETDTIARLGGDEFAIVQTTIESREEIENLAHRVLDSVSAHYFIDGHRVVIGASIGIARSNDCTNIEELFQNADVALYQVKSGGRNSYRLFERAMDAEVQARRQLEAELREAHERGEFEIHYQPIFNLETGAITCVEALLRWNHPTRGRLSPAAFMPLAEETGLMASIDAWVLEHASTEAARWPADVRIAVNLSPAKFKRRNLVETVQRALSRSGLAPQRLELEISERIPLREDDGSVAALRALRKLGVRIALDDFGTGSTSLNDLRVFRFDQIKIDRAFVAEMEGRAESAAIVAAIAGLGRSLGAETTAEGVETAAQAELARAAGCTQAQGYLYSRPLTAGGVGKLLRERAATQSAA